jgi:hypothetical protein
MSSNSSYNASNKLPNEGPIQLPPCLAQTPAPLALSPHTIQTTLQTHLDLNAMLLQAITNGLLQTIANREANTAVANEAYEDWAHSLKQCILHYGATFNKPPQGFILNDGQVSNFHIPGDGLYKEAKWIHLNNNGTVSGYTSMQGPNEQPYIIDLYATPNNSIDLSINTLPA